MGGTALPIPVWKRTLDLVGAGLGLVLLAPLMAIIALMIWRDLGRPLFFRQVRPGVEGRPFELIKFRTMTEARDAAGNLLPDQARLTPLGRGLRALSLDELPELFNVLKGDMSLVGPRPLLMRYLPRYSPEQWRRHAVKPGITGWAQVNGRNAITWEQKFALDVWYVDHLSLKLDLKILALTLLKVLRREGVDQPGRVGSEEFMGTTA
jgi:sugar transferase EpsL|uniref:Sugar transferase n=1 Tax=Desulfobacca acetoxidans TaxID=60893 RepID=A0A7C3V6C0_9BACT